MTPEQVEADYQAAIEHGVASMGDGLNQISANAGAVLSPEFLVWLLATLRDFRQDIGRVYDEVEQLLLSVAGDKQFDVPLVGRVEIRRRTKRTQWQHDDVFRAVISRLADEPGVFYDPESGGMLPPAVLAENVVARLRDVLSPSWKVTGLRAVGLQPDEFCSETEDGWSVKLPGRNEAA